MHRRPQAPALALLLLMAACGPPPKAATTPPRESPRADAGTLALRDSQLPAGRPVEDMEARRHYERARTALADSLMRERVARETSERAAMSSPSPEDAARRTELSLPITFLEGGYQLTPEARRALERKGLILASYPASRLRISGGTDDAGRAAADTMLGMRRAEAAKAFLVGLGISADRLEAGFGRVEAGVAPQQTAFALLSPWQPMVRE